MDDRELLELAAKGAGIEIVWGYFGFGKEWLTRTNTGDLSPWRPLTDDGDAFRLAVTLRFSIHHDLGGRFVSARNAGVECTEMIGDGDAAAMAPEVAV